MKRPSMKHLILDEMEQTNEKWLEKFRAETKLESKGYYQTIENFLKYKEFKGKSFAAFTKSDIENYVLAMWQNGYKPGRTDGVIAAISSFKNFLIRNYSFPQDFLGDVLSLQVNEESASDSKPLNSSQLHHIREFNSHNVIDEYIFEVYFQLGIDKQDLAICIPPNADRKNRCFRLKGKTIPYNEKISQLIDKVKKLSELETKIQNIDYHYFEKATAYFTENAAGEWTKERSLRYSDILRSHEIYMLRCPNPHCREFSENIKPNWVLVKTDVEIEYRLFCSYCKGRPYEY